MITIKLKGREIPLLYTVLEMKTIQDELMPLGQIFYKLFGRTDEEDKNASGYAGPEHLQVIGGLIRILGNAGLEEAGQEADLTDKWVMRALKPAQIPAAMTACMPAMNEGMASEIPEKKDDGPVDVTLEEMNKKKEADS